MTAKTIYYTALAGASAVGAVIANSLGGWDTGLQHWSSLWQWIMSLAYCAPWCGRKARKAPMEPLRAMPAFGDF